MSIEISIKGLDTLTADIERIRKGASFRWPEEILDGAGEMMKDEVVDQAPLGRTGELKDSVRVEKTKDTRRVVVDSPYGRFVNEGTDPSFGRYVPAIGKRLVNPQRGIHQGVPATHFFDNAITYVTPRIFWYVHRKLYEFLLR